MSVGPRVRPWSQGLSWSRETGVGQSTKGVEVLGSVDSETIEPEYSGRGGEEHRPGSGSVTGQRVMGVTVWLEYGVAGRGGRLADGTGGEMCPGRRSGTEDVQEVGLHNRGYSSVPPRWTGCGWPRDSRNP